MSVRVLRVLTRLGAGGPPVHCLLATRELRQFGYDTTLAIGRRGKSDGDMEYLLRADDPILPVASMQPEIAPLKDLRALWQLWKIMRRVRPHIVHTHTAKAGGLGRIAARLAGVPIVVHTFHGNVLKAYFDAPINRCIRLAERFLANITDAICVLSPAQARELAAVVPRGKIHIVPLGIDLAQFAALPDAPDTPFTVGWLGRFVPVKNLDLLAAVVSRLPGVRFLIAGDGPQRDLIEALAKRFPRSVFPLGWRPDVRPVIERCHVLLQTSKNEGTPLALIEGMAARRPYVSTAVGGVVDFEGGRLCGENPDELAAAVAALRDHPEERRELGERAAIFALHTFDQDQLLMRLDRLYREAMSAKGMPLRAHRREPELCR